MSDIPTNPIDKPHIDKLAGLGEPVDLAGPEEIDRRVQELLLAWQKIYFLGVPFETPALGGGTETKAFDACDILWGHVTPAGKLPIIHTVVTDRRDKDPVRMGGGVSMVTSDWTWNTFVRAHPMLPAGLETLSVPDANILAAERLCRRVADHYAWLLRSAHSQELSLKGIHRLRVLSGPRDIQSGAFFLRQIIYSARITWRIPNNSPA